LRKECPVINEDQQEVGNGTTWMYIEE
jgi:hypothetical protein